MGMEANCWLHPNSQEFQLGLLLIKLLIYSHLDSYSHRVFILSILIITGRFGMKNKHQVHENRKGSEKDIKYTTFYGLRMYYFYASEVRRKWSATSSLILIKIWFESVIRINLAWFYDFLFSPIFNWFFIIFFFLIFKLNLFEAMIL